MTVTVGIGKIALVPEGKPVQMLGLGSCVGVFIFGKDSKSLAAVHVMLPEMVSSMKLAVGTADNTSNAPNTIYVYEHGVDVPKHKFWGVIDHQLTNAYSYFEKGALVVSPKHLGDDSKTIFENALNYRFAQQGIDVLVDLLTSFGDTPSHCVIAGGAEMFGSNKMAIGQRNIDAVLDGLKKHNIPIKAQDVGGTVGRSVVLDWEKKSVLVRTKEDTKTLLAW